jgi:hypothetical protein
MHRGKIYLYSTDPSVGVDNEDFYTNSVTLTKKYELKTVSTPSWRNHL